jgi:hypothetical protein
MGRLISRSIGMNDPRGRGMARLKLRWPERRADLERRAKEDPCFGELCEAYESACAASEFWAQSSSSAAAERTAEYQALAAATERDILFNLT